MGLIKKGKRRSPKKPSLSLKVHVVQVQNIRLFKDFKCNPVCLVVTNSVYGDKTSKLRNGRLKWDEVLKLKLPSHPRSEWLRVILFDSLSQAPVIDQPDYDSRSSSDYYVLEHSNGSLSSSSGNYVAKKDGSAISSHSNLMSNTTMSAASAKKARSANSYLYVGEAKLSLLELFKRQDTQTSYNFSVEPKWYKLYDKRLQRHLKDKSESAYSIGEIQLGFLLASNSRKINTIQAYNNWKSSLVAVLEHKKNMKKSRNSPRPALIPQTSSESEISAVKTENTELSNGAFQSRENCATDDTDSFLGFSDNDDSDNDDIDEIVTDYDLLSDVGSIDSDIVNIVNDSSSVRKDMEEDIDISSIVPVFANYYDDDYDDYEYDEIDPEVISTLSQMSMMDTDHGNYTESPDLYDDEDEIEEYYDEGSDNLRMKNAGSRLKRLRRNNVRRNHPLNYMTHMPNYKVSKKLHAAGVIFIEFKDIKNLPSLKNRVSRKIYDMDPFVIATFGRRVFKTSWRKHSLNPVFNECAAFEVFPEESHFALHFIVMDKDSFSYNDKVAECDLHWSEVMSKQNNNQEWALYELPLQLAIDSKDLQTPVLSLRIRYVPYAVLKKFFWKNAVSMTTSRDKFDIVDLTLYLDRLGTFSPNELCEIFKYFGRQPWAGETVDKKELIEYLQMLKTSTGFWNVWKCPKCFRSCKPTRNAMNSKLVLENDLITHFAVCSHERRSKLLKPSYVSSDFASKRWFSKFLIKLTYGKYALGSNNANILVQDRETGIILEEKISGHVKLGMRIIYNGKGVGSKKFKALLKSLSVRQGKKFDDPLSTRQIEPFIKFHSLNTSECEEQVYRTFNEFFYRKLKPGSRIPEGDSMILASPADSRCTVFSSIHQSKEIWIKGSHFTLARLTKNYKPEVFNDRSCSIAIFRLAPQDYHRFHCPCNAKIGKPIYVDGEYYTVNPMAVRSSLDVFGENVRVVIPLESPEFGTILCIAVGAMMVGSIILTCKEGDSVNRGGEIGYFKFGGSTIIMVLPSKSIDFDTDLFKNSVDGIETLVKVGMSVGHSPSVPEYVRERKDIIDPEQMERIRRAISVNDEHIEVLGSANWEYNTLKRLLTTEYSEPTSSVSSNPNLHSGNSSSTPSASHISKVLD